MSLRRQLPVYSPLSASALISGAGALLSGGESSRRRVEERIRQEWRTGDPLLTGSGTTALTLAMQASHAAGGQGVALPAYGCFDLVTAALGARVPVHWYDIDPGTLAPDWPSLERALTVAGGASAIVIVHYYGVPVDLQPARDLAERFGGLIIEDAAQAIGGTSEDLPLGARGDFGVLSFGRGKGWTGGGGGALLINTDAGRRVLAQSDPRLAPPSGGFRSLVTTTAQWLLARPSVFALPSALPFLRLGETIFRDPEPAREMTSFGLGVLATTMSKNDREAETRRRNAGWLIERMTGKASVPAGASGIPGYLRLPVVLSSRSNAGHDARSAELGIVPGYPRVLNQLPGPTASAAEFPGAAALVRSLLTVPVHSRISEVDRQKILDWLNVQ